MTYHPKTEAAYAALIADPKVTGDAKWKKDSKRAKAEERRKAVVSCTLTQLEFGKKRPQLTVAVKKQMRADFGFDPMTILAIISIIVKIIEWWRANKT